MNNLEFYRAIKNRHHVYGTSIISQSPLWPGILTSIGADFVFIDTEHVPLNRETVASLCRYYNSVEIAPLVRIPSPDPIRACMALDAGAAGIVAPYIETTDQLRELAGAIKYGPIKGKKLCRLLENANSIDKSLHTYLHKRNESRVLIANIESVEAIEALDDLLSVKELDGLLVGPHDLSCSLGIPEQYDNPVFIEAVNEIFAKAKERNISAGIIMFYVSGFQQEIQWAREDATLILHSSDIATVAENIGKEMRTIKALVKNQQHK